MAVNTATDMADKIDAQSTQKPTQIRLRQRAIWLFVHRWMGIILGLPVAIIGLTGSLILMVPLMLAMQHGDLLTLNAGPQEKFQAPSAWVSAVRAVNDEKLEIIAVSAPNKSPIASDTALIVGHTHVGPEGHHHRVFSVDPYTSKLKGYYDVETSYAFIVMAIHTSLMIPMIGLDIVAILGVIMVISIVTGLYLWWPRPRAVRAAFTFKTNSKGIARWFNLHNVLGIYAALALLVLSITGVWMLRPEWIEPGVTLVSPIRGAPAETMIAKVSSCPSPTNAEQALALAAQKLPGNQLAYLRSPEDNRKFFEVNMSSPLDWNKRDGDTTVFVDPVCPSVVAVIDGRSLSAGDTAKRATVPFHNGLAFGLFGQIMVFLAGISLPVFYLSGVILWWRRRKYRKSVI